MLQKIAFAALLQLADGAERRARRELPGPQCLLGRSADLSTAWSTAAPDDISGRVRRLIAVPRRRTASLPEPCSMGLAVLASYSRPMPHVASRARQPPLSAHIHRQHLQQHSRSSNVYDRLVARPAPPSRWGSGRCWQAPSGSGESVGRHTRGVCSRRCRRVATRSLAWPLARLRPTAPPLTPAAATRRSRCWWSAWTTAGRLRSSIG